MLFSYRSNMTNFERRIIFLGWVIAVGVIDDVWIFILAVILWAYMFIFFE